MLKTENVINFVNSDLSNILTAAGWNDITLHACIGTLGTKFAVFERIKNLNSLIDNTGIDFSRYDSLNILRDLSPEIIVIAYDSEWQDFQETESVDKKHWERFILSWQFSYVKNEDVHEIVFVTKNCKERLSLSSALSSIYTLYVGDTSDSVSKAISVQDKNRIPLCLLCHTGFVDLSASERNKILDLMKRLTSVHKGLIGMSRIKYNVFLNHYNFERHRRYYPLNLFVRDTLLHAPVNHRSLSELGRAVGYQKINLGDNWISKMSELLVNDPVAYMEYAATDSTVTLLYAGGMYGYNHLPAVTITSVTANVMCSLIKDYLGVGDQPSFDYVYRGLREIPTKIEENLKGDIPYIQSYQMEPLNAEGQSLQYIASKAYHGGYNGCSYVGYFHVHTYDFDLLNAYPTAMCCVPDVDWENPISEVLHDVDFDTVFNRFFCEDDPMQTLLYAEVESFQFPSTIKFPNIVTMKNGIPIYTQIYDVKSKCNKDIGRIYTTGPELFLAHRLGAKIHCNAIYVVNTRKILIDNVMQESRCLSVAVKQLVLDRLSAKQYAKANGIENYLPDTILKNMVNSGYGKVAQDVIGKTSWDAYTNTMKDIGASKITNPVSASLITAIVRCILIAAQNQCVNMGYSVYSVTTDGFISNVPLETLKGMDLFGFRKLLSDARLFLTNGANPEIWEMKHQQALLLNFTTRGNVAPNLDGVCAHTGVKNKTLQKDSYEDRLWLTQSVLSRSGPIEFSDIKWDTFKEYVQGKVFDFHTEEIKKKVSVDFDLKRKPIRDSFEVVYPVVDGKKYEIANFKTEPYLDIGEYNLYKNRGYSVTHDKKGKPAQALRTLYDWDTLFFQKIEQRKKIKTDHTLALTPLPHKLSGRKAKTGFFNKKHVYTAEEKIITDKIRNCLYAHFAGSISIPLLGKEYNRRYFCDVLNDSGISPITFTPDMLKNYNKPDRFPHPLETKCVYMIERFLQKQEPIYSQLLQLQPPEVASN